MIDAAPLQRLALAAAQRFLLDTQPAPAARSRLPIRFTPGPRATAPA